MIPQKNIKRKILSVFPVILILCNFMFGQDVPIPINHLINTFIERHVALGNVSQSDIGVRPFTYKFVRNVLDDLSEIEADLTIRDKQLLKRFSSEFSLNGIDEKVKFPFSKSNLYSISKTASSKYQLTEQEPHFMSYKDYDMFAWMDLSETARLEMIDETVYKRFTDEVSVLGSLSDKLSFYVNFTMNRFVGDSLLVYQIDEYKNEDNPYFDFVNWTLWYQSYASFNISTKYGDFQLGKTPVIWGYSPNYSPILSGSAQTYPFINYKYKNKNVGFHFVHGSLLPYESAVIHYLDDYPQKYMAAHRIEFYLSKNFTFSFNEMVIYGNRSFEIEYLIPVNFYWVAEHNQGDKDNLLMALDCSWRVRPGLVWYNTLFWDELAWENLLSKWWGNKYVLQSGIHWTSKLNPYLLDIRIEGTVSRPWTYTHEEFVNSYSSAEIGLGLPQGPNSQSLLLDVGLWPSYKWNINFSALIIRKGIELGSSALHNYNLRNRELDNDTPMLLGESIEYSELSLESIYSINSIIDVFGKLNYNSYKSNYYGYIGINIDW